MELRAEMKTERRDFRKREKQRQNQRRDDEQTEKNEETSKVKGWDVMQAMDTLTQAMSSQQAALSQRRVTHHANWTWRSLEQMYPPAMIN